MKKILVPTDYSETASNALKYAVSLATFSNAELILLHIYHIPIPAGDVPVIIISPEELAKDNAERIQKLETYITTLGFPLSRVKFLSEEGMAGDEIPRIGKEQEADMIVMGISGVGALAHAVFGSVSLSVIKNSGMPVLIIPPGAVFKVPEKIALAYNYKKNLHKTILDQVIGLVNAFGAKLYVVDVVETDKMPDYESAVAGITLENALRDVEHDLYFPEAEDVTKGLNEFVDAHQCDWLVMLPHKHSFLYGLFHKSETKSSVFHTHIPLLAIHH